LRKVEKHGRETLTAKFNPDTVQNSLSRFCETAQDQHNLRGDSFYEPPNSTVVEKQVDKLGDFQI